MGPKVPAVEAEGHGNPPLDPPEAGSQPFGGGSDLGLGRRHGRAKGLHVVQGELHPIAVRFEGLLLAHGLPEPNLQHEIVG
eukprot:137411-Alexandrium_andersonii.AAC.1